MMIEIVFLTLIALCTVKWMKWKIAVFALTYYMEKNQYKLPNDDDMRECTNFVVTNMVRDLLGR